MKRSSQPIGQAVIGFYFLPLIVLMLFSMSGKSKMGFLAATVAVSLSATAFFLLLKSWEQQSLQKKKEKSEPQRVVPLPPQIDLEAMQKRERELEESLQKEFQLEREKARSILLEKETAYQKTIVELRQELHAKEESRIGAEETLLEKTLHAKILEEQIVKLQSDVSNLQFELKTALKVGSRK